MRVRPYSSGDWEQLCAIHDSARKFELEAAGLGDAFLTLEQTAENEGLFSGEVVVAEQNERIHGFAAHAEGELTWLYVDPASFRKGIGRLLLRHVVQSCNGCLSTEVLVGNAAALNLYFSEGFKIQRRIDGKLVGNESFAASGYLLQYAAEKSVE
ncbi:MAG: GNAT family N-acetyltransferase [Planctomycetaceae bacterium]|nr:GNAT family N-acetyltransferase [Planctomycetaceae bacterium]